MKNGNKIAECTENINNFTGNTTDWFYVKIQRKKNEKLLESWTKIEVEVIPFV